jgi:hypothetical protein
MLVKYVQAGARRTKHDRRLPGSVRVQGLSEPSGDARECGATTPLHRGDSKE